MQELTFAAPKTGPRPRPAAGRDEGAEVAPIDRRVSDRGREDDFGSVVDAEERAAAKKPADDATKAEPAEASDASPPAEAGAAREEAPAFEAEIVEEAPPEAPAILAEGPEPEPADGEAAPVGASVAEAVTPDLVAPPQDPDIAAAPLATDTRTPAGPSMAGPSMPGPAAVAPPATPPAQAVSAAPPAEAAAADTPAPDAEVAPSPRAGPEAPTGAAQPVDPRGAAPSAQQAASQPPLAGGFALGGAVTDGLDWRLTPNASTQVPTPARTTAQIPPQAVAGQIAVAIAQSSGSRIEVRLDPPELGRVQIQLNPTERGVQVVVMSERPETGDFLRRHGETLARELVDAGYGDVTMEFTAGGSDTPRDRDGTDLPSPRVMTAAETRTVTVDGAPERPRAAAAGTLDIRL